MEKKERKSEKVKNQKVKTYILHVKTSKTLDVKCTCKEKS